MLSTTYKRLVRTKSHQISISHFGSSDVPVLPSISPPCQVHVAVRLSSACPDSPILNARWTMMLTLAAHRLASARDHLLLQSSPLRAIWNVFPPVRVPMPRSCPRVCCTYHISRCLKKKKFIKSIFSLMRGSQINTTCISYGHVRY